MTYMQWMFSSVWIFAGHVALIMLITPIVAYASKFSFVSINNVHHHTHKYDTVKGGDKDA